MKKLVFVIKMMLVATLLSGLLVGTGCQPAHDLDGFRVFYINQTNTSLMPIEYELQATEVEEQIEELLQVMQTDTGYVEYMQTIPDNVAVEKHEFANGFLKIYFASSYSDMDEVSEVLCRAGIVKTMVQLEDVNNVSFYVNGQPLLDARGHAVGVMNNDSFIDNPGEDIATLQETELTLYFASSDGKSLVKEVQLVHYDSNVPVEKRIVEQLLKTPASENAQTALPSGAKLITISVMDGICVVNFDDGFLTHNYDIAEEVVIYSIVNSLTELETIKTVQIAVNGETNRIYREKLSLADQYTRDLSLVSQESDKVEVIKDEAPVGGVLNNRTE